MTLIGWFLDIPRTVTLPNTQQTLLDSIVTVRKATIQIECEALICYSINRMLDTGFDPDLIKSILHAIEEHTLAE